MKFSLRFKAALLCLCLPLAFSTQRASPAGAEAQDFPDRGQYVLRCIEEYLYYGGFNLERPITVEGEVFIPDQAILASKILFAPDSLLVVTAAERGAGKSRLLSQCGDAIYVIADIIVLQGEATITWARPEVPGVPLDRGQAASGASGAASGESGRDGATGAPGNPGFAGLDAPTLFLVAKTIEGGPLHVNFSGQSGGRGGTGQTGGSGGNGRTGRSASQSLFDCKREPGPGGNGGDGGQGGPGGRGGDGGQGSTVVAILPDYIDSADHLDVVVTGGLSGQGGEGGEGGREGSGGSEGAVQTAYCRSPGRAGHDGAGGSTGERGLRGEDGPDGDLFVLQFTYEDFEMLFAARRGFGK